MTHKLTHIHSPLYVGGIGLCTCIQIWVANFTQIEISYSYGVATKWWVSFAKEPYKRDDILQKRPIIVRSLLIVSNAHINWAPPAKKSAMCTQNRGAMHIQNKPNLHATRALRMYKKSLVCMQKNPMYTQKRAL